MPTVVLDILQSIMNVFVNPRGLFVSVKKYQKDMVSLFYLNILNSFFNKHSFFLNQHTWITKYPTYEINKFN